MYKPLCKTVTSKETGMSTFWTYCSFFMKSTVFHHKTKQTNRQKAKVSENQHRPNTHFHFNSEKVTAALNRSVPAQVFTILLQTFLILKNTLLIHNNNRRWLIILALIPVYVGLHSLLPCLLDALALFIPWNWQLHTNELLGGSYTSTAPHSLSRM
jgi:hypothetical protein